jgi:hypothetical protein
MDPVLSDTLLVPMVGGRVFQATVVQFPLPSAPEAV